MQEITRLLETFVEKGMTAGASALILQNGQVQYAKAVGFADRTSKTPFQMDTILRIYSMSKIVTAAAVLSLCEKGKLTLDDAVSKYLDGFKNQKVARTIGGKTVLEDIRREVAIHDLMTMTAGLGYISEGDPINGQAWKEEYARFRAENKGKTNTVGFANLLGSFPLSNQPGETWLYGYCCDVLGAIVEVVSGMPFSAYLKETFFEPLGMEDTFFAVPAEKACRVATIYLSEGGQLVPQVPVHDDMDAMPFESGGAGLYSTLPDYARFAQMLLGKGALGSVRCLKSESVRLMTRNQLTDKQMLGYNWNDCPGYGYGYAVRVMTEQQLSCYDERNGSFGWNGAAGTSVRIDPERNLVVLFGTQVRPPEHEKFLPQLMKAVGKAL